MARLIDADALIEEINKKMPQGSARGVFKAFIDEQPTAYNVEKVVKKIKKRTCKKCRNILGLVDAEKYCKEVNCEIEAVCEIVRRGGVDERT